VSPGNYTLSAVASVVPGEVDVEDNRFVDGVVRIKPWFPPPLPVEYVLPRWLLAFLFLLAVLVGACLVLLIGLALWCMRERKKEVVVPTPGVKRYQEYRFKTTKTCSVCGREFLGVYTFCPYCFTFHGKDYE
jgi:hypothetical protein